MKRTRRIEITRYSCYRTVTSDAGPGSPEDRLAPMTVADDAFLAAREVMPESPADAGRFGLLDRVLARCGFRATRNVSRTVTAAKRRSL